MFIVKTRVFSRNRGVVVLAQAGDDECFHPHVERAVLTAMGSQGANIFKPTGSPSVEQLWDRH